MPEVRCTVNSCEFWEEGDYCAADMIWVKNNFAGDADDDLFYGTAFEFAKEPGPAEERRSRESGGRAASTSRQTCCKTMRPKEKGGGEAHRGGCR